MKKTVITSIIFIFMSGLTGSVAASEWGCKCILCLSNPGGAKQYSECHPPINRLEQHLEHGGSFPSCSEMSGIGVQRGYERFYTCKEAYGPGWKMATWNNESTRSWVRAGRYCYRIKKYKMGGNCPGEVEKYCADVKIPIHEYRPPKMRSKPHYIQLRANDGSADFQRFWY